MAFFWIAVFIVSTILLVKGADWLLESAEKIGLAVGLSPFIIGVVIVGLGTSFPELISSLAATLKGVTEIVVANAIGSNIANILLIVGLSTVVGGHLSVSKNLINLDIPLLAVSTAVFIGVAMDKQVTMGESILLIMLFVVYILYTVIHKEEGEEGVEILPNRSDRRKAKLMARSSVMSKIKFSDWAFLVVGIVALVTGAKFLIDSVIVLSQIFSIGVGVISLFAVAVGTSLPELIVSAKAAWQKKPEVALGNIFGSNVFNILFVVGMPGLFKTLQIDEETFMIGLPVMAAATILFVISGISKRIHVYEGAMYLIFYVFFIGKLFGFL